LVYFMPKLSILLLLEIFYGRFVYFGIFFPVLIFCIVKNLATLLASERQFKTATAFRPPSCLGLSDKTFFFLSIFCLPTEVF
jgi:hypothetical protein